MKTPSSFGFCDICFTDSQHLRQRDEGWVCTECGNYEPDDDTLSFDDIRTSHEARRVFRRMLRYLSRETLEQMRDKCDGLAEQFVLDELWRRHNATSP